MIKIIRERLRQGMRPIAYPRGVPVLPDRFLGLPVLDDSKCQANCSACAEACPTHAIVKSEDALSLDMGCCLFCNACVETCPRDGAIRFSQEFRLATRSREGLVVHSGEKRPPMQSLDRKMRSLFGHSLKLRQVSAGGDGASEADLNVLGTVVFDIGRFGIQFVASPRHADAIVVTGPVTENMKLALLKTFEAVPAPKLVIAVGANAISGGIFRGSLEVNDGVDGLLPVDLYIPGDPPHPLTILDGLLRLLGRSQ